MYDCVKYHEASAVSQISKTLPSPSPNGLEDLLREILVFKSRRGAWWKKIGCLYVMYSVNLYVLEMT